jgi:hypothetical protein
VFGKRPVPPALQNLHHRLLDKPIWEGDIDNTVDVLSKLHPLH